MNSGEQKWFFERYYVSRSVKLLKNESFGATQTIARGDLNSSSSSIWWLKRDCLIAAFIMNRPDEERQCAPEWIKSKQIISAERLKDSNRPIGEAI